VLLNAERIPKRERTILVGLFLSKFDSLGLEKLGFDTFTEAFNVLGYAIGSPPGSIKNYRDEFDPLFSNQRKGWHKRPRFSDLIKSFAGWNDSIASQTQSEEAPGEEDTFFAKRLITGLAAEQYFETVHHNVPEFRGCTLANTTRLGCGYDFRLQAKASDDFLAVEVKGMRGRMGSLSLTPKEYAVATALRGRFFLFVVKNFQEAPYHQIFQDPMSGVLQFRRNERTIVQISWLVSV
jgi:hypothetical protein